jgi:hypothetical protein
MVSGLYQVSLKPVNGSKARAYSYNFIHKKSRMALKMNKTYTW